MKTAKEIREECDREVATFRPHRRLKSLAVLICVLAPVALLCFMQFGSYGKKTTVAQRPISEGLDAITMPDQYEPVSSMDNGQQVVVKQLVVVSVKKDNGTTENGSGFLADRGLVVTAAHLFSGSSRNSLEVICYGKRWPAVITYQSTASDVVIASAPNCSGRKAKFAAVDPEPGTPVVAVTAEFDLATQTATRRVISMTVLPSTKIAFPEYQRNMSDLLLIKRIVSAETPLVSLSGEMHQGNSGSPVMTAGGTIVGMASFVGLTNKKSYAISASEIVAAIASAQAE